MLKILPLLIVIFLVNLSFAQQDKQLTHYMFDKMSFNPAATGFVGYCGTFIYRNQWDRVENAPNTSLFNFQANLPKQNLGLGVSYTNDAIGFQKSNTLTLNGAYHFLTNAGILSGGIGIGIVNVGFSPDWIPPVTISDPSLPGATSDTGFDMNLGLYWYSTKAPYYVGISTTHLAPPNLKSINYSVARHYYAIAGYNYRLQTNRKILLKPSVLVKADGATAIFDLNLSGDIWLKNTSYLWAGISYRMADAVSINAGYAFSPANNLNENMMKIGYSFDIMTNPLNPYGRGSHELMLSFCMFPPAAKISSHGNPFTMR